ncbi:MAG TPA: hypothetical protein VFF06_28170 [Polyangia bacterium]|nr:hypothetical protein [Polyangia bacterium]
MRLRFAFALAISLSSTAARAYDFEISAETVGQGYQLRAGDSTLVNRRRLTQYLGLDIFNVGPRDLLGRPLDRNQFYLAVSMRFEAELGEYATLQDLSGHTPQRELFGEKFDLLYAYVGARNLFGFVDAKLGRQLTVDLFDFYSFDGLSVEAKTPVHLAVEAWGGLNVSGAQPFDSPVYRTDGVALGGNPTASLGARQEDALEPTFGVALKTIGLRDVQTRVSYLRTMSFTGDRQPGEPSSAVLDEKVAWTARGRFFHGLLVPWFGFRYNLLVGRLDELQAGARVTLSPSHALSAEYVFAAPTFDGDSIWNVFGSQAFNDARLTYDATLGRLRLFARGFVRLFSDEPTSSSGATSQTAGAPSALSGGGSAGARLDLGRGFARVDGYYEDGYGGTKGGVDLSGRFLVLGDWLSGLVLDGRISYVHFRDDSRTIVNADSLGLQGGVRYSFWRGLTAQLAVEENVNRFYSSQLRVLALLDVSFFLGSRGAGFARPRAWSPAR